MRPIPTDQESVRSRGRWLALAYFKATLRDFELLCDRLKLPVFNKSDRNRIRLEMAVYTLSQWNEIVETALREMFSSQPNTDILDIRRLLSGGAWTGLTVLMTKKGEQVYLDVYEKYVSDENHSELFWDRLKECGLRIDFDKQSAELSRFESSVIYETAFSTMLDCLSMPQSEIDCENRAFQEQMDSASAPGILAKILRMLLT